MTTYWLVKGPTTNGRERRLRMDGSWEQTLESLRELRADGNDVRQARAPESGAPRGFGTASSHIKR